MKEFDQMVDEADELEAKEQMMQEATVAAEEQLRSEIAVAMEDGMEDSMENFETIKNDNL